MVSENGPANDNAPTPAPEQDFPEIQKDMANFLWFQKIDQPMIMNLHLHQNKMFFSQLNPTVFNVMYA